MPNRSSHVRSILLASLPALPYPFWAGPCPCLLAGNHESFCCILTPLLPTPSPRLPACHPPSSHACLLFPLFPGQSSVCAYNLAMHHFLYFLHSLSPIPVLLPAIAILPAIAPPPRPACSFFSHLAGRAAAVSSSLHVLACSPDQVGVTRERVLAGRGLHFRRLTWPRPHLSLCTPVCCTSRPDGLERQ